MSHYLTNTKRYSHVLKHYIVYTTNVPNIGTVLQVTVESGETEEGTDIFEFIRDRPIHNSLEFDGIHGELTSLKMKTKIFDLVLLELAFFWFQKEAVGFENVEDLTDDTTMFLQSSSGDEDIIHIDKDSTS